MIIIKIIIVYFIQIRHTDDFPSTGTRLVYINSQDPPLSSKSEITDSSATPRTQRTVAGMAAHKQSRIAVPFRESRQRKICYTG